MLLEAEEQTEKELDQLRRQLTRRGLARQQAHDHAWETVRERAELDNFNRRGELE